MRTVVGLADADAQTCGGKAGALGVLLRAGVEVPEGVVLDLDAHRAGTLSPPLVESLARALDEMGGGPVVVRSSASDEDGRSSSAAGQLTSVLGVTGLDQLLEAVRTCWASLHSPRAVAYRRARGAAGSAGEVAMAVLVQRQVDAEVSGVMFTPGAPGGVTHVEAAWGLGPSVVGGTVMPDAYTVHPDGTVSRVVGDKHTRLDRHGSRLVTSDVPTADRTRATLDDARVRELARLGQHVSDVLEGPQDVEWVLAEGRVWVVQARPVTAALPAPAGVRPGSSARGPSASGAQVPSSVAGGGPTVVRGTPGSSGVATGTARVVRGPGDFSAVRRGDVLVCPWTDPAWTPLLGIVAGVVTETGGVLSHAAIVARERGIPAVLGVARATSLLDGAPPVALDGDAGTVTVAG